jgi:hypothetical protein
MKYEGYFSNVWYTVAFSTPFIALIYYIADKNSILGFNAASLGLFFYFLPISLLVLVPVAVLHYQVYKKIEKTKLPVLKARFLLAFSAMLTFMLAVILLRQLSKSISFLLYPLYPFYLTPVIILYLAVILICSFAYKYKSAEVQD